MRQKEAEERMLEALKKEEEVWVPRDANKVVYIDNIGILRLRKTREAIKAKATDKAFHKSLIKLMEQVAKLECANVLKCEDAEPISRLKYKEDSPLFGFPVHADDYHPGPDFAYDILAQAKPGDSHIFRLLRTHSVVPRSFTEPPSTESLDEHNDFGRSLNPLTMYAKHNEFQKGEWYSGFAVPEKKLRGFLWIWRNGERKIRLGGFALERLPPLTVPTALSFLCDFERGIPFVSTCVQPIAFSAIIIARDALQ